MLCSHILHHGAVQSCKAVQQVSSTRCLCPQAPQQVKAALLKKILSRRQGWSSAVPPRHTLPTQPPAPCCGSWRECLARVEEGALAGLKVPFGRRCLAQQPGWAPAQGPHITRNNQATLPRTRPAGLQPRRHLILESWRSKERTPSGRAPTHGDQPPTADLHD